MRTEVTKQMARRAKPKTETKRRTIEASATIAATGKVSAGAEVIAAQEIDRIIARLDAEIPEAQRNMDALLARLRTTRVAA
jgi:hypothetical protein